jgi:hypothetical protein
VLHHGTGVKVDVAGMVNAQVPATGDQLEAALALALDIVRGVSMRERSQHGKESMQTTLWQAMLTATAHQNSIGGDGWIPAQMLTSMAGVPVAIRKWKSLLNWFERKVKPIAILRSQESKRAVLYPGRLCDHRGGNAKVSQARYCVSFAPYVSSADDSKPSQEGGRGRPSENREKPLINVSGEREGQQSDVKHLLHEIALLKDLVIEKDLEISILRKQVPRASR